MGNKKSCSCGYWSEAQQECLYTGSACIRDDERKKPEVTEEFIKKWVRKIGYEDYVKQMLKEAGVEIIKK